MNLFLSVTKYQIGVRAAQLVDLGLEVELSSVKSTILPLEQFSIYQIRNAEVTSHLVTFRRGFLNNSQVLQMLAVINIITNLVVSFDQNCRADIQTFM